MGGDRGRKNNILFTEGPNGNCPKILESIWPKKADRQTNRGSHKYYIALEVWIINAL